MAERKRPGRTWGPIRAESQEAAALARFLRDLVNISGMTLKELEKPTCCSKTTLSNYLSGKVPTLKFVEALVSATVPQALRDQRLREARQRWQSARKPTVVPVVRTSGMTVNAVKTVPTESQQLALYDRLTRALERQVDLERARHDYQQIVFLLMIMLGQLHHRIGTLTEETRRVAEQPSKVGRELGEVEQRLAESERQRLRAEHELARARSDREHAERLAASAAQHVYALTQELQRIRRLARATEDDQSDDFSVPVVSTQVEREDAPSPDPFTVEVDQALDKASAVLDASEDFLNEIANDLRDEQPIRFPTVSAGRAVEVVPDNSTTTPDEVNNSRTGKSASHLPLPTSAATEETTAVRTTSALHGVDESVLALRERVTHVALGNVDEVVDLADKLLDRGLDQEARQLAHAAVQEMHLPDVVQLLRKLDFWQSQGRADLTASASVVVLESRSTEELAELLSDGFVGYVGLMKSIATEFNLQGIVSLLMVMTIRGSSVIASLHRRIALFRPVVDILALYIQLTESGLNSDADAVLRWFAAERPLEDVISIVSAIDSTSDSRTGTLFSAFSGRSADDVLTLLRSLGGLIRHHEHLKLTLWAIGRNERASNILDIIEKLHESKYMNEAAHVLDGLEAADPFKLQYVRRELGIRGLPSEPEQLRSAGDDITEAGAALVLSSTEEVSRRSTTPGDDVDESALALRERVTHVALGNVADVVDLADKLLERGLDQEARHLVQSAMAEMNVLDIPQLFDKLHSRQTLGRADLTAAASMAVLESRSTEELAELLGDSFLGAQVLRQSIAAEFNLQSIVSLLMTMEIRGSSSSSLRKQIASLRPVADILDLHADLAKYGMTSGANSLLHWFGAERPAEDVVSIASTIESVSDQRAKSVFIGLCRRPLDDALALAHGLGELMGNPGVSIIVLEGIGRLGDLSDIIDVIDKLFERKQIKEAAHVLDGLTEVEPFKLQYVRRELDARGLPSDANQLRQLDGISKSDTAN